MPERLTAPRRSKIIRAYLQGYGRNDVARKTGETPSTVSREIERFGNLVDEYDIQHAAGEYNVSQIVEELHEIAQLKRQEKLTDEEILAGADIAKTFRKNGIEVSDAESFAKDVFTFAKEKGYDASRIIEHCSTVNRLEEQYGPFDELKQEWEDLGRHIDERRAKSDELKKQLRELGAKTDEARRKLADTLFEANATENDLKSYRETKATLLAHGLDLKNLDDATIVLKALKAQGFKPRRVITKLKNVENLEEHKTQLQLTIDQQKEVLQNINEELKLKQDQLSKRKHILSEAQKIEETGLTIRDIQSIKEIVIRISANKGKTPREAIRQFREDLRRNYDPLIGLRPEVDALRKEKSKLNRELKGLTKNLENEEKRHAEKIRLLNQQYASKKAQIDAYTKLREQEVDDETLKRWNTIMGETKLPPKVIEAELRKQATLTRTQSEVEEEIRLLTHRKDLLTRRIEALDSKKQQTEAALNTIEKECIQRIEQTRSAAQTQLQQAATDLVKNLRTATNETITTLGDSRDAAVKSISQAASASGNQIAVSANTLSKAVDKATTRTTDALTSLQRNLDQYLEKIKTDLAESMKNADALAQKALEAGRELSKHEAAHLLIKIYAGEPVTTSEVLSFYLDIIKRFAPFLEKNKPQRVPQLPNTIIKLTQELRTELGVGTGPGRLRLKE